jgi:23S rRNA G2445 N2-methylase RlmL
MTSELGAVVLAAPLNTLSHPEADYGQPWWIQSWDTRPFAFSASLEPLVASAAVSIATSIHLASHPRASDGRPLRMLDPCCGSGTVLVAGLAHGHTCSGSDLREDFVTRAKENLEYMQLSLDGIAQHDALQPFPPGPIPDLIVCNPPWGKHIGAEEDGARIIASVVRQFGGATMCWVANATALATAIGIAGVELAYHCRVGGVEAFVLRTYRAE